MAQQVMGLDLGSHAVKAVVVRFGLRGRELVRHGAEPVVLDDQRRGSPSEILAAAGRLWLRLGQGVDVIHCALPGEDVTVKTVDLPAGAARRIEQVLRYELDELLPYDIEDAIFDHVELGRDGERISLLTATVLRKRIEALITGLAGQGIDPREVGVAPLAYRHFVGEAAAEGAAELVAVLDLGHQRTNVMIREERVITARTILRGGRDLTARLAEVGKIAFSEAEAYKRQSGIAGKVGEVLRGALEPLVREVRQTIGGHLAAGGGRIKRVLLCGGGSQLTGLEALLANELGVPVERSGADLGSGSRNRDADQGPEVFLLAQHLGGREQVPRNRRINLRRGALSFKGDFQHLRRRMVWAGFCLLAVLLAWIFHNYAEYSALEDESAGLQDRLLQRSREYLGREVVSRQEIDALLGQTTEQKRPFPEFDAFDVLVELSRRIPPAVVHDVELLEIRPKRVTIKATVDVSLASDAGPEALTPTDLIKQELEKYEECFTAVRMGKVQTVGERKRYEMEIDSKCP
jgi:general secretion pathway protein L